MVIASSLTGFGLSLQVFVNSQANGFVGVLKDNELKLGILYASYGLGAFASPLVSTQFSELPHWSYHYIVSAVMAVFNVTALVAVFKFKTQDEVLARQGIEPGEVIAERENKFKQIIKFKSVHFLAIFALIYIGVEVTLGGAYPSIWEILQLILSHSLPVYCCLKIVTSNPGQSGVTVAE
ncbi:hypothetical protein ONZ45_g17194 [Pleurotus djamor]|nr:hypothetical protein ONZ45_g17194 [Pleurotus djamor]